MGHFDAEKQRATAISKEYARFMPMVQKNGADSTTMLRTFIGKVEKHQKRLADIAATAEQRLGYVEQVEHSIVALEGVLKKAQAGTEADAANVYRAKTYGPLVEYNHNKAQPLKPQLVKAVQDAIADEVKRGRNIIAEVEKSAQAWTKSATKHVAWCDKAKAAVSGATFE